MCELRKLSGRDVVEILSEFGFEVQIEKGCHVKLRRCSEGEKPESITVALHEELDVATLRAIIEQAGRFIPEHDLVHSFSR